MGVFEYAVLAQDYRVMVDLADGAAGSLHPSMPPIQKGCNPPSILTAQLFWAKP
jgi:hypothetical protein